MTVALGDAGDQLALQIVQGGEQGQRATADVIMSPGLDVSDAELRRRHDPNTLGTPKEGQDF